MFFSLTVSMLSSHCITCDSYFARNKHIVIIIINFADCRCYVSIKYSIINDKNQIHFLEKLAANKNEKTIIKCRAYHFY